MRVRHPFTHRLAWNPLIVSILFAYLLYTTTQRDFPIGRVIGLGIVGLWLVLSLFDVLTKHRLLNWLYPDEVTAAEEKNDAAQFQDRLAIFGGKQSGSSRVSMKGSGV